MNIFLTFDYEIYFGKITGTVEKCMLYPTNELIKIAEKHNVQFTFFVDSGFIIKLNEYKQKYTQLELDYNNLVNQIKYLADTGHDIQLHIHPHWEDSYYDGNKWCINTKRYMLSAFSESQIEDIVYRYKAVLTQIINKDIRAYRAGGLCLQPFDKIKKALIKNGIKIDSSVFGKGYINSDEYYYDFRTMPDKDMYCFENNPVIEHNNGIFTEYPITTIKNSPLFFWKLFLLGRINPQYYRPIGDGVAMNIPGFRRKLLTQPTYNPLSMDGFNASLLQGKLKQLSLQSTNNMVVIGHPKALSLYSLHSIDSFINKNKRYHNFTTFSQQIA